MKHRADADKRERRGVHWAERADALLLIDDADLIAKITDMDRGAREDLFVQLW